MPDRAARRVLLAWLERLRPVEEAVRRARWDAACEATPGHEAHLAEAAEALEMARHDARGLERVEESLEEGVADPILRRGLKRLRLALTPHRIPRPDRLIRVEAGLAGHFARYRAEVGGRRLGAGDVARVLATATDAGELETAWRAAVGVGEQAAEGVREAVGLRNAHARALGFDDYRALKLGCDETDAAFLDAFLTELADGTEALWHAEKDRLDDEIQGRFQTPARRLAPWHYGDVFLQSAPPERESGADPFGRTDPVELARKTFEAVGLDVDAVLARSDLRPREGKNPHAFCTHLDRAGDVRILANVVPSRRWTRTMLHECGHAAYDSNLDFDLPTNLVEPPHAALTEGVAMFFERLADDAAWRVGTAGIDPEPDAARALRRELLPFVRWGLVVSRFEERLYAETDEDPDLVWWELVERYQGIRRPDPLPRGGWAAKIHVACTPVYYHAYLLGAAVASQLAHHLPGGAGLGEPGLGAHLRESVFQPAATKYWRERVREATGHDVSAKWLLADLGAGGRPDVPARR